MPDLNDMLNSFLSSPENTEKLMQAINILKNNSSAPNPSPPAPEQASSNHDAPPQFQMPSFTQNPQTAQTMDVISSISTLMSAIGSLNTPSKSGGNAAPSRPPISIPPQFTSKINEAAAAINSSKDDRRISLLEALRPYLNTNRAGFIDDAIKMVRFSSVSSAMMGPKTNQKGGNTP